MEIWYFKNPETGLCPVLEYLGMFRPEKGDSASVQRRKLSLRAKIDARLNHVSCQDGNLTYPAKPLRNFPFLEICLNKDSNILIRVCCVRCFGGMLLLHAFEKPSNYDTEKDRRSINREYEKANIYYNAFLKNPTLKEKYE